MKIDAIAGYNPRSDFQGRFDLVSIDTPDGAFGYLVGSEGNFTDVNGRVWVGSTLIQTGPIESLIGDNAPAGSITLTYFQDPSAVDLQAQIVALGAEYLDGREIQFYFQPFNSLAEMYKPVVAPVLEYTRTMRGITFSKEGVSGRSITVNFEAWTEGRNYTRKIPFSEEGHGQLLGAPNPSLRFRPTDNREDEKLFG